MIMEIRPCFTVGTMEGIRTKIFQGNELTGHGLLLHMKEEAMF